MKNLKQFWCKKKKINKKGPHFMENVTLFDLMVFSETLLFVSLCQIPLMTPNAGRTQTVYQSRTYVYDKAFIHKTLVA